MKQLFWQAYATNTAGLVAENHSIVGGLGETLSTALLRNRVQPAGFELAGLPDQYLDAGALPTLDMTATALAARFWLVHLKVDAISDWRLHQPLRLFPRLSCI